MAENIQAEENQPERIIPVEYRGNIYQVPLALNKRELEELLQKNVIPEKKLIKKFHPQAELTVSEYVYLFDESIEGKEKSMWDLLKGSGAKPEEAKEWAEFSRKKGFNPVLSDRLSWRQEYGAEKIDDEHLPFARRTYIIGHMVVDQSIFEQENGPTFEQDTAACTFFLKNAVAVDGVTLLRELAVQPAETERVSNQMLLAMVEKAMGGSL